MFPNIGFPREALTALQEFIFRTEPAIQILMIFAGIVLAIVFTLEFISSYRSSHHLERRLLFRRVGERRDYTRMVYDGMVFSGKLADRRHFHGDRRKGG